MSALIRDAAFPRDAAAVADAVRAYLEQTEAEKRRELGEPAGAGLPARYRGEVDDPSVAYDGCRVLLADIDGAVVGVVVTAPRAQGIEIKRLWADPTVRGRGIGSALLDAAIGATPGEVRLSVWGWRTRAQRLYSSRGFRVVDSWEERERLVCMVRPARAAES